MLQAIADSFTSVLIWKIARHVFAFSTAKEEHGWLAGIAALGWTFFQPAQTFSIILMPTSWMIAAFWFCVWQAMKPRRASIWNPWAWMGLFVGFVANGIATILFLLPLLIASAFLGFYKEENLRASIVKTATSTALIMMTVFAGTSPCWLHNYFVAHEPVLLSAHSGINFYIGNNPTANGYPKIPPGMRAGQEGMLKDSITMAEAAAGRRLKRVEVSNYWSAKANDYIHQHFSDWLKLMAVKFRNFWNAYQYDDLSLITLFSEAGVLLPGLRFGLVAALALAAAPWALAQAPKSRWVASAVLLHLAALMPVFVTERYRMAAVPGLLIIASFGLWKLWRDLRIAQWKGAATYGAMSAAAALFVSWPQSDRGLWALDSCNTGIKETEAGKIEEAQKHLERAYALVPENSEINFALGNLWWKKRDRVLATALATPFAFVPDFCEWREARKHITQYYAAAYANRRHAGVRNNLAVLALAEGNPKAAAHFLSEAVAIEPGDASAHYLLAKTRWQLGDYDGAHGEIAIAISLDPQRPEFRALADRIPMKPPAAPQP